MKKIYLSFYFICLAFIIPNYEIPYFLNDSQIITHSYYTLSYNETHEQANWVGYILDINTSKTKIPRTNNFNSDQKIKTKSATSSDYIKSGYDRGHLAPAADMNFNLIAMKESFLMSNISPQNPSFNRGIWKKLENLVRAWSQDEGKLYITTGPIFKNSDTFIGKNKVTVPSSFYKVILVEKGHKSKAIGFLLPNAKSDKSLEYFSMNINQIEEITGIDFFYNLDDEIEDIIEAEVFPKEWNFEIKYYDDKIINKYNQRCTGITKKGVQCKRNASNQTDRCFQH